MANIESIGDALLFLLIFSIIYFPSLHFVKEWYEEFKRKNGLD
jgi:hypothetical protein